MKTKNLSVLTLLVFSLSFAGNLSAELASAKVLNVVGTVTKIAASGKETPLTKGTILKEGDAVRTTQLSSAELIFSNGSELTIDENTSVKISKLQQESFTGGGSYEQLKADPSKSQTLLSLNYGDLSGHVKKLKDGSNFDIETPLGTAAIRGTRWQVFLTYNAARGEFSVTVNNFDGLVDFISKTGGSLNLEGKTSVVGKFKSTQDNSDTVKIDAGKKATLTVPKNDPYFQELMKLITPPATGKKPVITQGGGIDDDDSDEEEGDSNNDLDDFDIIVVSPEGPAPAPIQPN